MPTIVGHFSILLAVGWILWLAWLAAQVVWYRRILAEPAAPVEAIRPEKRPEPPVVPRAPGVALRSMTAASSRESKPTDEAQPETPPAADSGVAPEDDVRPS